MDNIPDEFICPITLEVMEDPVICNDGYTYERSAIESITGNISPMTRQEIDKTNLIPNRALKNCILRYNEKLITEITSEPVINITPEPIITEIIPEPVITEIIPEPVINIIPEPRYKIRPLIKHIFYINSSSLVLSNLLNGFINDNVNYAKQMIEDFYDKIHSVDIDILEVFNESLKDKLKYLESGTIINKSDITFLEFSINFNIDILIELFSMIDINASFLLIFYSDNGSIIDYTNIKIVLSELLKLIKYVFL
jgi:hypothetical protein